jgi:hypothetical protein
MTYQDEDRIRNPNDPWQREWGTGTAITILVACMIMAGIIVYGTTNTTTGSEQHRLARDNYRAR